MKKTEAGKEQQKIRILDGVIFGLILLGVFAVTLWLFSHQTTGSEQAYHSDMKAYIRKMLGTEVKYSFPYPIFFKVGAFFNLFTSTPEFAIALATAVLNALAMVLTKLALNYLCLPAFEQKKPGETKKQSTQLLPRVLISLVTFSLFFVSMLYIRPMPRLKIKWSYLGIFSPTPWHNATYIAARPFMILAFLWAAKLFDIYEEVRTGAQFKEHWKDYLLFSLWMLLVTMTKPSYTIVHLGAAGLVMVWRLLRDRFKNFLPTLYLGLCYIPTLLDLLYQYKGVFVAEEGAEGGIGIEWMKVWSQYSDNIPLAILQGVGFPLLVLLLHLKSIKKDSILRFSWQVYVMGFLMAALLYEKGFRVYDFNFSWGYMCGMFVAFLAAAKILLQDTGRYGIVHEGGSHSETIPEASAAGAAGVAKALPAWALVLEWLALLAHLACGIRYFATIMTGAMYY